MSRFWMRGLLALPLTLLAWVLPAHANPYLSRFPAKPRLIQSNKTSGTGTTGITLTATKAGSLIVIGGITGQGITSITDNKSNTYSHAGSQYVNAGAWYCDIWYAKNSTAGVTTVTVTTGGGSTLLWIGEVAGIDILSPLASTNGVSTHAATTVISAPAATVPVSRSFILTAVGTNGSVTGTQSGNPFTTVIMPGSNSIAYYTANSAGTWGAAMNQTSGAYCASTAAFRAAN